MKTLKILFAAAIIAGFATSAMAQINPNTTVGASATVLDELTISKVQDVNFGNVAVNSTPILNAENGVTTDVGFDGFQYGHVAISAGGNVRFTFAETIQLTADGETDELTYTPEIRLTNDNFDFGGTNVTNNSTHGVSGNQGLIIGGNLGTIANVARTTYTGDLTITVEYF